MARRQKPLPIGITIRKNKHTDSIQITFTYKGVQCRELLHLEPTAGNIKYATNLRHEILAEIERDKFIYTDKFPDSKRAEAFGFKTRKPLMKDMLNEAFYIKAQKVKASSLKVYANSMNGYLLPAFGHIRVDLLTPRMIRKWVLECELSAKSIRNHRVLLDFALNLAVQEGYIQRNPTESIKLEHILNNDRLKTGYKPDPFNRKEIEQIIQAADPWYRQCLIVSFFSGIRPGEAVALNWTDIDFENRLIDVNKNHSDGIKQTPKTDASYRKIDMLPVVYDALLRQKELTYFEDKPNNGFVFTTKANRVPFADYRHLRRDAWIPALKRANVRYRNQYQTRHTFASQMLTEGNDIWWLAKQLGHRGIDMINTVYGQWIPDNSEESYKVKGSWDELVPKMHEKCTDSE